MLEKEIESRFIDWAITRKDSFDSSQYKYLGRQIKLPMGIADVLLLNRDGSRVGIDVVEVKREPADINALAQCLGYVGQVDEMIEKFCFGGPNKLPWVCGPNKEWGITRPVIVAPEITGRLMERCYKANIFDFIKVSIEENIILFEIQNGWSEPLGNEGEFVMRRDVYKPFVHQISPAFETLNEFRWHDFGDMK